MNEYKTDYQDLLRASYSMIVHDDLDGLRMVRVGKYVRFREDKVIEFIERGGGRD